MKIILYYEWKKYQHANPHNSARLNETEKKLRARTQNLDITQLNINKSLMVKVSFSREELEKISIDYMKKKDTI